MTKVEITNDSPSAKLIAEARKTVEVSDTLGRTIVLKRPSPLQKLDFTKAAGGAEINQLYLAEVAHLQFVTAIDGAPIATPATDAELRALYSQLGDEGNEAAQLGVFQNFMPAAQPNAEADLKNS